MGEIAGSKEPQAEEVFRGLVDAPPRACEIAPSRGHLPYLNIKQAQAARATSDARSPRCPGSQPQLGVAPREVRTHRGHAHDTHPAAPGSSARVSSSAVHRALPSAPQPRGLFRATSVTAPSSANGARTSGSEGPGPQTGPPLPNVGPRTSRPAPRPPTTQGVGAPRHGTRVLPRGRRPVSPHRGQRSLWTPRQRAQMLHRR